MWYMLIFWTDHGLINITAGPTPRTCPKGARNRVAELNLIVISAYCNFCNQVFL